jgi:hypothetical protein
MAEASRCTHCNRPISDGLGPVHLDGEQQGKQRCCSDDSGLPYGYNAHPVGTPCQIPCRGEYEPVETSVA